MSRTTHGIAYDTTNDEIIAPNPLAAAVVIFRGGATGEEAPVRTIQGARTGLSRPETVAVDEKNNELFVGDPGDRRVLVYSRDADGDAKPLRTIQGTRRSCCRSSASPSTRCAICSSSRPTRGCRAA